MTNKTVLSLEELGLSLTLAKASAHTYLASNSDNFQEETGISIIKPFDYKVNPPWNVAGFLGNYKDYSIVAFRGTNNIGDWRKNIRLLQDYEFRLKGEIDVIKTHFGFSQAITEVWEDFLQDLQQLLQENASKTNWKLLLTGHSLGGALAILTAHRLNYHKDFKSRLQAVYTYGAPRVGNRKFKESFRINHYRFNYGQDPVPGLPPFPGYDHHGQLYYLPPDSPGVIRKEVQDSHSHHALFNVAQGGINLFIHKPISGLAQIALAQIAEVGESVGHHHIDKYVEHIKSCQQFTGIIQGLQDGSLRRSGGTIRDKQTNQVIGHLFETPEILEQLVPSLLLRESSLAPKEKQGVPMQLSQLPIGANVLSLGINLAGFAYIGKKLGQLRNDLEHVKISLDAGLNHIDNQLQSIQSQLDYIKILVENNAQEQKKLGESISELHKLFLDDKMATLQSIAELRKQFPDNPVEADLREATQIRIFMENQALSSDPASGAERMLRTDIAIKGWAAAVSMQVYLLLEVGEITFAETVLDDTLPKFKDLTSRWLNYLLSHEDSKLATTYRFAAPLFKKYITSERIERITRLSQADLSLTPEQIRDRKQDAELELGSLYFPHRNDDAWIRCQVAVAEYLDMLSELLARLESLQAFTLLCKRMNLKTSREILPGLGAEPGLYILPTLTD